MTPDGFRRLALGLPDASEGEHMDHPDFRVRGKIFATIHPGETWGVVMLTPSQQRRLVAADPDVFTPVNGGWGRKGATRILLKSVKSAAARAALRQAWQNRMMS